MNDKTIKTIHIEITGNAVIIRFPVSIFLNEELASSLIDHLQAYGLYQDKSYIIYLDNLTYITKEAMTALSSKNLLCVRYVALIVRSTIQKIISAIFLAFNAPPFQINVFTNHHDATKAVSMQNNQASYQREYLEGYIAARAGKRINDCPYLSVPTSQLKKFDNWVKGHNDYIKGLRLDFDNEEIIIEN